MRFSLAHRIQVSIVAVMLVALIHGAVGVYAARQYRGFLEQVAYENLTSVQAAEELEIALLEQRGYVSSFLLDRGGGDWLQQMSARRQQFGKWLLEARATAHTARERRILDELELAQADYVAHQDEVLNVYRAGERERAEALLLRNLPIISDRAYALCEEFIDLNSALAIETTARAREATEQIVRLQVVSALVSLALSGGLLWMLQRGLILPLRRMAAEARDVARGTQPDGAGQPPLPGEARDELPEVRHYLTQLMSDVTETRKALATSHERVAQAERLASVGKLAATVAHEIRNPLTAVKLWLFSLRREVGSPATVRRQFDAISDEINRLEQIVQSFLEFSRPPALRLSRIAIAELLGNTHELLRARLAHSAVALRIDVPARIPPITGDADQLRQVFLNLFNNSLDAMGDGGTIDVSVSSSPRDNSPFVVVRVRDTGRGLTDDARTRLFEPFFTTKQQGTGLGLCVVASILARHGGALHLERTSAEGTQFAVWLPAETTEAMNE